MARITELLAAHGSLITAALPFVNGLLESAATTLEAAAVAAVAEWMDCPPSMFEVKESFRSGDKTLHKWPASIPLASKIATRKGTQFGRKDMK